MDKNWMCTQLPEEPPKGLIGWAMKNLSEELGDDHTVIRAERIRMIPTLTELMENQTVGKSVWAESCTCTVCDEEYICKKIPGFDGFYIAEGEDGCTYPTEPGQYVEPMDATYVPVLANERMMCPICGANTTVIHARKLRGGRTKQIQVATLHAIHGYAVIVYWLVYHVIEECGGHYGAEPRYAYALGERGGITAYSHRWPGVYGNDRAAKSWRPMETVEERWENRYHDWGSINDTKAGTVVYKQELPSLIDTTGEKTGLLAYWKASGVRPVDYIRLWKKWKPVENLCNLGFTGLVAEAINKTYYDPLVELSSVVDIKKSKPHEILGMRKTDFKKIQSWDKKPNMDYLKLWKRYQAAGGALEALAFLENIKEYHVPAVRLAIGIMEEYQDCDLDKLWRYMAKQQLRPNELQLLVDARAMCREITGRQDLTEEERWPRRLQSTHTRLAAIRVSQISAENAAQYQAGFDKVLAKYGSVQWTDKELAIILPKCNGDLIAEGNVLRHCVGGYGETHSMGNSVIFFVRHYRRPERSYYTLNISFTGRYPAEVQLHGYGNERHGAYKEHHHNIPKKVRKFVDQWEKHVLLPWWNDQQKKKERKMA